MELSTPSQPEAERKTACTTPQNGKEEESEMDSISRIKKSSRMIIISYSGEEKEPIEEEKAAQVHSSIEIHTHFEFLALPQRRQQTSQVAEAGEDQSDTRHWPSCGDPANPRGWIIRIIPVNIGKREEPEDECLAKEPENSKAGQANLVAPRLVLGSTERRTFLADLRLVFWMHLHRASFPFKESKTGAYCVTQSSNGNYSEPPAIRL
jgi:hypothetical protein